MQVYIYMYNVVMIPLRTQVHSLGGERVEVAGRKSVEEKTLYCL